MQLTKRKIVTFGVLAIILAAGVVWLLIFNRFVRVPTAAMANTILPGENLVVDRFVNRVKRGDIIIFKNPENQTVQYVSRVVGLPGETIEIRDEKVFINDKELNELRVSVRMDPRPVALHELSSEGEGPYRVFYNARESQAPSVFAPLGRGITLYGVNRPFAVPDANYFVMGDNRDNSQDSRYLGPVARELITGKPYFIYWSVENGEGGGSGGIRWNRVFSKLK